MRGVPRCVLLGDRMHMSSLIIYIYRVLVEGPAGFFYLTEWLASPSLNSLPLTNRDAVCRYLHMRSLVRLSGMWSASRALPNLPTGTVVNCKLFPASASRYRCGR